MYIIKIAHVITSISLFANKKIADVLLNNSFFSFLTGNLECRKRVVANELKPILIEKKLALNYRKTMSMKRLKVYK